MFTQHRRALRRPDHALADMEVLVALLHAALVARLAVIADGEPYVVPMNFAYQEEHAGTPARIIVHGASQGRLIEALARDPRVCVEVDEFVATLPDPVLCDYDTAYASILCAGRARILTALDERSAALRVLARKYAPPQEAEALKERTVEAYRGQFGAHTAVIEIAVESMSGKRQPLTTPAPRRDAQERAAPGLETLGNVPAAYRHQRRLVTHGEPLALPGALLKWYDLRRGESIIPRTLDGEARAFLRAEAEAGALDLGHGLGFVILHLAAECVFLIVCVWRNTNELWEMPYTRDLGETGSFRRLQSTTASPGLCVWELAPAWHERQAWVRYLSSARDEEAKRAYLEDQLSGMV